MQNINTYSRELFCNNYNTTVYKNEALDFRRGRQNTTVKKGAGENKRERLKKFLLREYKGEDNENVHEQRSAYENMQYLSPKEKEDFEKKVYSPKNTKSGNICIHVTFKSKENCNRNGPRRNR